MWGEGGRGREREGEGCPMRWEDRAVIRGDNRIFGVGH